MDQPVFSARQIDVFAIGERRYHLAPLSFTERAIFRSEHSRRAGFYPTQQQMFEVLRSAVASASPSNADELIGHIDRAEAAPEDAEAQARLSSIEAACAGVPAYGNMLAARRLYLEMQPYVAARHALRGWEGPELPPFEKDVAGLVPDHVLDLIPPDDVTTIGWRAVALMQPGRIAEGNLPRPSSSPESQPLAKAATSRKTAGNGSSRAKRGK